jgi:hypothetical protein
MLLQKLIIECLNKGIYNIQLTYGNEVIFTKY